MTNPHHPITGQFRLPDIHALRDAAATNARQSADLQAGADERAADGLAAGHTRAEAAQPYTVAGGLADIFAPGEGE